MTNYRIIFFGTEDFSANSLVALINSGYNISAVITKPDQPKGRGHKISEPLVKTIATKHDIPVWQPSRLSEITEDIIKLQPVAGVLVSYGKIIPQNIINLFTPGIINVHPSLLPRYRGPSPIESAILNQDHETGVTIMQLSAEMDAGPIYIQQSINLDGTETKPTLYNKLSEIGNNLLTSNLPKMLDNTLTPIPQDDNLATYCSLLTKQDSCLDPTKLTASEAEARVRAFLDYPRTKITLGDTDTIITMAHTSNFATSKLSIKFKDDNYLVIDELIAPSGKKMTADAYLRGHKLQN